MPLSAKTICARLALLKPLLNSCSLETIRKGQNKIGEMMEAAYAQQHLTKEHDFGPFHGAWMIPADERRQGVILYLHGGGYTCGGLDYAKGFGSMLAARTGTRVLCAAYRLAPEHPFPAALEDAETAYRYLLAKGFGPEHITLCGESAGGGLCFSLCIRLRELGLPQPAGILAISPWTDLTASGPSYEENKQADPSMSLQLLNFFADCYTENREDPLVSPLFGQLEGLPPVLTFVGGDEIMLSDSQLLHEKLLAAGCVSRLVVAPQRWHGYVLYGLEEDASVFTQINDFLNQHMDHQRKLRWMRLDNAAKIYPAARNQHWSSVFRVSATLTEPVDKAVLQAALDVTARRFPSIATRLRKGVFWYYLQQIAQTPELCQESSYPLVRMSNKELRRCAFRVIAYENRIALEIFHSLTDGTGAIVFLKTLLAEYLLQKHGVRIPATQGVLGRLEEPSEAEMEDSFQKYAAPVSAERRENDAWRIKGTPETAGFLNLTCMTVPVEAVLQAAHSYGVSVTTFLAAAMMQALQRLQMEQIPDIRRRKPIRVLLPINLRRLFPSQTLRNFSLYTIPEIDPRLGEYSFKEICHAVHYKLGMDNSAKVMSTKIAANVGSERLLAVKLMPLFIKNAVMKAVFLATGEKKTCLDMSNLGNVELPEAMQPYVERIDFILGPQSTAPYNCAVISYGGQMNINFIRDIKEPVLEGQFAKVLLDMGIPVTVQSNRS